jgi:transcriptional regulator with XRE-family HTH domain
MPTRQRAVDLGTARGRKAVADIARELELARLNHGLSYTEIGRAVSLSDSQVGRIARGRSPSLSIELASRLLAVVGLELSVRAYPKGQPVRDAAHLGLLDAFRSQIHPSLRWRTEVPLPVIGDLRAWDAIVGGRDWDLAIEAETRPPDLQALDRRLALKQRDGGIDSVILLLSDTRHNHELVRGNDAWVSTRFPVVGRRALELLSAGANPGGSSIVFLPIRAQR